MFADAIRARFSGWGAPAGIAGICLLCYVNSLDGSFHYDDFHSIVENPGVRSLANVPAFFWDITLFSVDDSKGMYRPVAAGDLRSELRRRRVMGARGTTSSTSSCTHCAACSCGP